MKDRRSLCAQWCPHFQQLLAELDNLTRQVRQYRLKSRPKLPKIREEVLSVLRDYDSDFIMEIDESLQICLITTVENLNFLSSSTHILADSNISVLSSLLLPVIHISRHTEWTFHTMRVRPATEQKGRKKYIFIFGKAWRRTITDKYKNQISISRAQGPSKTSSRARSNQTGYHLSVQKRRNQSRRVSSKNIIQVSTTKNVNNYFIKTLFYHSLHF